MKTCPTCQASYPDGFRYCPNDSDTLINNEEFAQKNKANIPSTAAPVVADKGVADSNTVTPRTQNTSETRVSQPAQVIASGSGNQATINQSQASVETTPKTPSAQITQKAETASTQSFSVPNGAARNGTNGAAQGASDGLKLMLPESGGLISRLIGQVQQFVRDFGKPKTKVAAGAAGSEFLLPDDPFVSRVIREFQVNWTDFRRDPKTFAKEVWRGEGSNNRRLRLLQAGVAFGVIAYAFIFTTFLLFGLFHFSKPEPEKVIPQVTLVDVNDFPKVETAQNVKEVPKGKGGFTGGSKPKVEQAGGGGGGGRNQPTPASKGNPPQMSMVPQVMPPNPEPPKIKNPTLVVPTTTMGDPMLSKPMPGPDGLKDAPPAPPSSGPGSGAGIGNGKGTGVGSGDGAGQGPGQGFNKGGGNPNLGGGPGTDGSGGVYPAGPGMRPIITYKEKAKYTEEARQNRVQGAVVLSAVFTADGRITSIKVVRGLPDGLTEKAIEAAQRIKFNPAMKNGAPVSVRMNMEFNFALY